MESLNLFNINELKIKLDKILDKRMNKYNAINEEYKTYRKATNVGDHESFSFFILKSKIDNIKFKQELYNKAMVRLADNFDYLLSLTHKIQRQKKLTNNKIQEVVLEAEYERLQLENKVRTLQKLDNTINVNNEFFQLDEYTKFKNEIFILKNGLNNLDEDKIKEKGVHLSKIEEEWYFNLPVLYKYISNDKKIASIVTSVGINLKLLIDNFNLYNIYENNKTQLNTKRVCDFLEKIIDDNYNTTIMVANNNSIYNNTKYNHLLLPNVVFSIPTASELESDKKNESLNTETPHLLKKEIKIEYDWIINLNEKKENSNKQSLDYKFYKNTINKIFMNNTFRKFLILAINGLIKSAKCDVVLYDNKNNFSSILITDVKKPIGINKLNYKLSESISNFIYNVEHNVYGKYNIIDLISDLITLFNVNPNIKDNKKFREHMEFLERENKEYETDIPKLFLKEYYNLIITKYNKKKRKHISKLLNKLYDDVKVAKEDYKQINAIQQLFDIVYNQLHLTTRKLANIVEVYNKEQIYLYDSKKNTSDIMFYNKKIDINNIVTVKDKLEFYPNIKNSDIISLVKNYIHKNNLHDKENLKEQYTTTVNALEEYVNKNSSYIVILKYHNKEPKKDSLNNKEKVFDKYYYFINDDKLINTITNIINDTNKRYIKYSNFNNYNINKESTNNAYCVFLISEEQRNKINLIKIFKKAIHRFCLLLRRNNLNPLSMDGRLYEKTILANLENFYFDIKGDFVNVIAYKVDNFTKVNKDSDYIQILNLQKNWKTLVELSINDINNKTNVVEDMFFENIKYCYHKYLTRNNIE